jgi:hypothetical protein
MLHVPRRRYSIVRRIVFEEQEVICGFAWSSSCEFDPAERGKPSLLQRLSVGIPLLRLAFDCFSESVRAARRNSLRSVGTLTETSLLSFDFVLAAPSPEYWSRQSAVALKSNDAAVGVGSCGRTWGDQPLDRQLEAPGRCCRVGPFRTLGSRRATRRLIEPLRAAGFELAPL